MSGSTLIEVIADARAFDERQAIIRDQHGHFGKRCNGEQLRLRSPWVRPYELELARQSFFVRHDLHEPRIGRCLVQIELHVTRAFLRTSCLLRVPQQFLCAAAELRLPAAKLQQLEEALKNRHRVQRTTKPPTDLPTDPRQRRPSLLPSIVWGALRRTASRFAFQSS